MRIIMQTYLKVLNIQIRGQVYYVQSVSKIISKLSISFYTIYGDCNFAAYPFILLWLWDSFHFILLQASKRKYEQLTIV